jgi:rhodanese-related sulfurtransferase
MTTVSTMPARLDVETLREWLAREDSPRLLDVRTPAEFGTAHIPGSYNVPLDLLKEHREELRRHLEDEVVLVCRSGNRAGQAESLLAEAGLPNLHVLDGGVMAWEKAGAPLRRGTEKWALERQVRLVAGGIVATGVVTSLVFPPAKWVAGAIGAGLVGAAVTDSCLMGQMLSKLPYNRDASCDLQSVLRELED